MMSVDDCVFKMINPEMYEFTIDGITYYKQSDIPPEILSKNVNCWDVSASTLSASLYCLVIVTWDSFWDGIIPGLERIGFNDDQFNAMIDSGASLSNITEMALCLDSVKSMYTKLGYNQHNVQPIIYEFYANKLSERLNKFISGT